jgi:hypothetical protein
MIFTQQLGQVGRLFAPTDPLRANVVLLLDMESGEDAAQVFVDRSPGARAMTAVNQAQIDKAFAKFGSRSLICDGGNDAVTTPDSSAFTLGTSDFCLEAWVYWRALTGQQFFAGQADSSGANTSSSFSLQKAVTTNKITAFVFNGASIIATLTSGAAVAASQWYHIALQRSGSSFALHIDGVLEASASTATGINDSSNLLAIGRLGEYTLNTHDGNFDDVRFTVGATRYPIGGNFTPPNMPHPLR